MTRFGSLRVWSFLAVTAGVYATVLTLAQNVSEIPRPGLMSVAIALDLTLTVGLAYLLIGRGRWPRWRLVPLFVIGSAVALRVLPESQTRVIGPPELWIGALEVIAIAFLGFRVWRQLRSRTPGDPASDLLGALRKEARELTGSRGLGDAAAWELATLRYAVAPGETRRDGPGVFGYTQRSDFDSISVAILVLLFIEMVPVHMLLLSWKPVLAWIVLALSVYSVFWILGDKRSRARRPIVLLPQGLALRGGIRWDGLIPWDAIEAIEPWNDTAHAESLKATVHDAPELHLRLRRAVRISGPYGWERTATGIGLRVDEAKRFREEAAAFLPESPQA